jgi:hypothetical protein
VCWKWFDEVISWKILVMFIWKWLLIFNLQLKWNHQ